MTAGTKINERKDARRKEYEKENETARRRKTEKGRGRKRQGRTEKEEEGGTLTQGRVPAFDFSPRPSTAALSSSAILFKYSFELRRGSPTIWGNKKIIWGHNTIICWEII